jgi:hypothetical protein
MKDFTRAAWRSVGVGLLLALSSQVLTAQNDPNVPLVRIDATSPIAEESSFPYRRIAFVGEFTVSRTGPADAALPVFLHYAGSATPKDFLSPLPWSVTIPAGATSTVIRVEARPDEMPEGIETLTATLSHCPPDTEPPLGIPCVFFPIDPARASATIFVRDDGITEASLALTRPADGASFHVGQTILLEATAIDLNGYISRVEFWANEERIGVSEIFFIRAPDPGTPIQHQFEWTGATVGDHKLTARARGNDSDETELVSPPVHISVRDGGNLPPHVRLTSPASGDVFEPMEDILIAAEASDPDGWVRKVAFFANGMLIGEAGLLENRLTAPNEPRRYAFPWRRAEPGRHVLTARAVDNLGAVGESQSVEIQVRTPIDVPIVSVAATDPFAVEPRENNDANTATFRIWRHGGEQADLRVRFSLGGRAQNGADYAGVPESALIPAGQSSVPVVIRPLADEEMEGLESVVLRLEEPLLSNTVLPEPDRPAYRIGRPGRAVAVISDQPWIHLPGHPRCVRLRDGFVHVCFDAETGRRYRIEAGSNMRDWECVHDAVAVDGSIHFIDEESEAFERRFYRLVTMDEAGQAP